MAKGVEDQIMYDPIRIVYNGAVRRISEWSKIVGVNEPALRGRINNGWSIPEILGKKKRAVRTGNQNAVSLEIPYDGKLWKVKDLAKELQVKESKLRYHLSRRESVDKVTAKGRPRGSGRVLIDVDGKSMTMYEIADKYNIKIGTLWDRYRRGCMDVKSLTLDTRRTAKLNGVTHTLSELSRATGVPYNTLTYRWEQGKRGSELTKQMPK
jgi:hypothetical protein